MRINRRALICVITSFISLLVACEKPPERNSHHVYIILAPINPQQAKLSKQFLLNAKENNGVNGETQIVTANNTYTVVELCKRDTPDFVTPGIEITNESSPDTVTKTSEKSVKEIIKGSKQCTATASSLVEVSKNINQAASQPSERKIIVFFQAPFSRDEISDNTLKQLTKEMENLAKSNRVEKIIIFGINPNGADRLSTAFQALKHKSGVANQSLELVEHMKEVRQKYLQ